MHRKACLDSRPEYSRSPRLALLLSRLAQAREPAPPGVPPPVLRAGPVGLPRRAAGGEPTSRADCEGPLPASISRPDVPGKRSRRLALCSRRHKLRRARRVSIAYRVVADGPVDVLLASCRQIALRSYDPHSVHRGSLHQVARDASHFGWDKSIAPVLEIESGEDVELEVRDASGGQLGPDSGPSEVAALDFERVNPVTGPVFVKGARPGDVLVIDILQLRPRNWGWTALIPGFGLLADEFAEPWLRISEVDAGAGDVRFGSGVVLPYEPFPGTIGVAPPEPGLHSIVPPRPWGGNMDTKHLRPGTTLLLPVGVEGALFSVGDTHAAMGDGEVCGTAVEAPMEIAVRLSVRRDVALSAPQFHVPAGELARTEAGSYHVCTGVGPDLMEATRDATRAAVDHVASRYGRGREEAYALLSVAADLRIHEVVDAPNWVVGCFVPEAIFDEEAGR